MTRRSRRDLRLARRSDEGGFTLVELVVALFLLAILMSSSMYSVTQGMKLSRDEQDREVASNIATGVLQQSESAALSTAGFTTLTATVTTPSISSATDSGVSYKSTETSEWESQGQSRSVCASGTDEALILRTTVVTSWGTSQSVSESTLLAPPNGTFSTSDGSLPVLVEATAGTGEAAVLVTVSPTGTTSGTAVSITTGQDGCAFFAGLPAGTYNVSVSATGGVAINEQATYSVKNLTVNAGQLGQTVDVFYQTAGSIAPTWSTSSPSPAQGMPVSIDNPSQGLTDNMFEFVPYTAVLTPVYPSTYTVFAGSCTDADPNGQTTGSDPQPIYPETQYPDIASSVTVASSAISNVSVPLYPLDLQIQPSGGVAGSAANSATGASPTATTGQGGVCLGANPVYTLSPVVAGVSDTSVGLGEMTVSATVQVATRTGTTNESGSVQVWVKPNGIYSVTNGIVSAGPVSGPVTVPVS